MIFFGWLIGGPVIGYLSDKLKNRKKVVLFCIFFTLLSLTPVLYIQNIPLEIIYLLLILTGVFSSAELLNFSLSVEMNPKKIKATAIGLTNTMVAIGGAIMQPLIGIILDFRWDGQMMHGTRIYSSSNYELALSVFPITLIIAFFLTLFLKEKKYEKIKEPIPAD